MGGLHSGLVDEDDAIRVHPGLTMIDPFQPESLYPWLVPLGGDQRLFLKV